MTTVQIPSLITSALISVSVIFPILSLVAILFRYKARRISRAPLQADDWWIGATWLLAFPLSINAWIFGGLLGVDHYNVDPMTGITKSLMCLLIASTVVQVSLCTVKISILLFYKRIFSKGSSRFNIVAWGSIALVSCWGIIFFFLVLFESTPISASWTGKGHVNFDVVAFGLSQCATSFVLDLFVLALPLPVVLGLQMDRKRKVAVILIFWLGAFCCVAAIVRFILLKQGLALVAKAQASGGSPPVQNQSRQFIFMLVEPHCSMIAACLPCYGPLFTGGRAPESLIRSVRSVFSLRSRASKNSDKSWRPPVANNTRGEHADSMNLVSVGRGSCNTESELDGHELNTIRVTKGIDVSTK